jgi:surfactin synthase thioesterase subunit
MILLAEKEFAIEIPIDRMAGVGSLAEIGALLGAVRPAVPRPVAVAPSLAAKAVAKARSKAKALLHGAVGPQPAETPPETADAGTPWPEVRRRIMLAAQTWPGSQVGRALPVMAFHAAGGQPPLFWCFNGAKEPPVMARELGPDQPLYALRSMQAVVERGLKRGHNDSLAADYAAEIIGIQPEGPYFLGGNCQSGRIAEGIARALLARGRPIAGLFLLDYTPPDRLPLAVSLFFGRQSQEHNPFLSRARPELDWQDRFESVTWDIVPGGHGHYFDPQNAPAFCSKLKASLVAARQAAGRNLSVADGG